MAATISPTEIPDVLEVVAPVFGDERGFFTEVYNASDWGEDLPQLTFAQDNVSSSAKGTLRGLHYQLEPHAQGKLVRVLQGAVFDVAVDIRDGSPTYGKWVGRTLTQMNGVAMYVPPGFAHGFYALEDKTVVLYKCTATYAPKAERGIRFDDPAIGIEWPGPAINLSEKDTNAPTLAGADTNFVYPG